MTQTQKDTIKNYKRLIKKYKRYRGNDVAVIMRGKFLERIKKIKEE